MDIIRKYFDDFTDVQNTQFNSLTDLYTEWNQKINVISRKDMDNFYEHHVLHSLSIATQFDFPSGYKILDLGAGGGFPGIPLAIFFPQVKFLLVDSINKKLNVVKEVATAIGLTNVETLHSRVEDIKNQKFNIVISRAVAPLKDLWFWSRPLLLPAPSQKPSGLICLKGGDLSTEIAQSGLRPRIWEIDKIFDEEYFKEKFILNTRIT